MKRNITKILLASLFLHPSSWAAIPGTQMTSEPGGRKMIEQALQENNANLEFTQWEV